MKTVRDTAARFASSATVHARIGSRCIDARPNPTAGSRAAASQPVASRRSSAMCRRSVSMKSAQEAQVRVERFTLRAPAAGTVLRLDVREGEHWDPEGGTDPRARRPLEAAVRLEVDERDVARVHLGQAGYVTADAHGERRFPGKVVEIARRMGAKTDDPTERLDVRVLEVVMQLEHGREVVPGQRVTGYLDGREHRASR